MNYLYVRRKKGYTFGLDNLISHVLERGETYLDISSKHLKFCRPSFVKLDMETRYTHN